MKDDPNVTRENITKVAVLVKLKSGAVHQVLLDEQDQMNVISALRIIRGQRNSPILLMNRELEDIDIV